VSLALQSGTKALPLPVAGIRGVALPTAGGGLSPVSTLVTTRLAGMLLPRWRGSGRSPSLNGSDADPVSCRDALPSRTIAPKSLDPCMTALGGPEQTQDRERDDSEQGRHQTSEGSH